MSDMKSVNNDLWKSRVGFALAAMGSAVGLGNIWRFPYITGEYGGATFILVYLFIVLFIGIPLLLSEFSIGKAGQMDAVGSFRKLAPNTKWHLTGLMGVIGGILILSFYSVVSGWSLYYLYQYVIGGYWKMPNGGFEAAFGNFITSPIQPLFWQGLFLASVIFVITKGVRKGIEKANLIFMPALAILMIILAIYGMTLNNGMEGVKFLFSPDWSQLKNPQIYLVALGQAFFSLSVGVCGMLTYASYLKEKDKLPTATVTIGLSDTLFAIIAGVMIFPAVFSYGLNVGEGPPLVFITLPTVFANMPFGGIIGIIFFALLAIAAYTSALSLLELPVSYLKRTVGMTRNGATWLCGIIIFIIGMAASFGYGIWSGITIGDKNILDILDYITGNIMLPLGGLLITLFVGWYLKPEQAIKYSEIENATLQKIWYYIVKFIIPIMVVLIALIALEII